MVIRAVENDSDQSEVAKSKHTDVMAIGVFHVKMYVFTAIHGQIGYRSESAVSTVQLAQWLVPTTPNLNVVGSNPPTSNSFFFEQDHEISDCRVSNGTDRPLTVRIGLERYKKCLQRYRQLSNGTNCSPMIQIDFQRYG